MPSRVWRWTLVWPLHSLATLVSSRPTSCSTPTLPRAHSLGLCLTCPRPFFSIAGRQKRPLKKCLEDLEIKCHKDTIFFLSKQLCFMRKQKNVTLLGLGFVRPAKFKFPPVLSFHQKKFLRSHHKLYFLHSNYNLQQNILLRILWDFLGYVKIALNILTRTLLQSNKEWLSVLKSL